MPAAPRSPDEDVETAAARADVGATAGGDVGATAGGDVATDVGGDVGKPDDLASIPRLPRGRGLRLDRAMLFRIFATLALLVMILVMRRPCADATSKFVNGFGSDDGSASGIAKPGTIDLPASSGSGSGSGSAAVAPAQDPNLEPMPMNGSDAEIRAAWERARAKARANAAGSGSATGSGAATGSGSATGSAN